MFLKFSEMTEQFRIWVLYKGEEEECFSDYQNLSCEYSNWIVNTIYPGAIFVQPSCGVYFFF